MTTDNPSPTTVDFANSSSSSTSMMQNSGTRTLSNKGGIAFSVGVGGFGGVEFFVAEASPLAASWD